MPTATALRVSDLARELSMTAAELIAQLKDLGLEVTGPDQSIDDETALERCRGARQATGKCAVGFIGCQRADRHGHGQIAKVAVGIEIRMSMSLWMTESMVMRAVGGA